jgi:uncharacterized protein YlzI (FlbEa/FlbD family)
MIQLTRLNKSRLAVNSDLIKYVEQAHDTVITLVNGEKLVVLESTEEVIERFRDFRRSVLAGCANSVANRDSLITPQQPADTTLVGVTPEGPDCG